MENSIVKQLENLSGITDDDILFNWDIGIGQNDFYSLTSVALKLFGDVPEFNLKEIKFIIN